MPSDSKPAPAPWCYEYILRTYGLTFREGDRVMVTEECEQRGDTGTVVRKRTRLHYVGVRLDGHDRPTAWHPRSIEVVR